MNREKTIKITNRSTGVTAYRVPDLDITRIFSPGETKIVTFGEIQSLSSTPGGMNLLYNSLIIRDEDAIREILPHVEIEYKYGKNEVKNLLQNGSLDALLDCLDFAPQGVLDLVKDVAVDIELNDYSKRNAIKEKTGFDVSAAIEIKNTKFDSGDADNQQKENTRRRRVSTEEAPKTKQRRVNTSSDKIVNNSASWQDVLKK